MGWAPVGDATRESLHSLVPDSARLRNSGSRTFSAAGYQGVSVGFFLAAPLLEGCDPCIFEVSTDGGSSWNTLLTLADGEDDGDFRWGEVADPTYDDNPNQATGRSPGGLQRPA